MQIADFRHKLRDLVELGSFDQLQIKQARKQK